MERLSYPVSRLDNMLDLGEDKKFYAAGPSSPMMSVNLLQNDCDNDHSGYEQLGGVLSRNQSYNSHRSPDHLY